MQIYLECHNFSKTLNKKYKSMTFPLPEYCFLDFLEICHEKPGKVFHDSVNPKGVY